MLKNQLFRKGMIAMGGILAIGLLFSACKKNDDVVETPAAGLMAYNLVPDQSRVAIALSGSVLPGGALPYTSYTGRYLNIFPGTRVIESFNSDNNQTLDSTQYSFDQNKFYSLFVVGSNGTYLNIVTNDNYDSLTASSGNAYVRYINAVPDSSASTISIGSNGNSIVNELASFGEVSEFVSVTPGDLAIALSNESSIDASRTITVQGSKAYTILLTGIPNQQDPAKAVAIRFIENGTITD